MSQNLSLVSQAVKTGIALTQPEQQKYFVENLFTLAIIQKQTSTRITMDLHYNQLNTEEMPTIVSLLEENLPSVLSTICYNDKNLPFNEEVQNTELGHLFEHILLEYLCQHKLAKGARRATYAGRTKWNWTRDPLGRFHIHLNCGKKDADILPLALEKTVALMKVILSYNQQPLFVEETVEQTNGLKNGERRCE
ncbi:MAG: cyanophycin synthetase family protein [Candidatus Levyibacteriota bacterium]